VRVRVTDMRGVDLARYPFDFDLTFAALLMHPDGTVYHRYGGRDQRSAGVWLSGESWRRLLAQTLEEHAAREASDARAPVARPRLVLEELPEYASKDKGDCIHCHMVFPALRAAARARGTWRDSDLFVHPAPARIGLDLERDDQVRVTRVADGSPAAAAGLRVGDRLLAAGRQRLLTASDLSYALHEAAPEAGRLELALERDGGRLAVELALPDGWKVADPLEFSWRPSKWDLTPAPGFGGPALDAEEKRALGVDPGAFAFRVGYLVTWGDKQRYGKEAQRAGLRKGDVVVSLAGRADFASVDHVHAWWRFTRRTGEELEVVALRGGQRRVLRLRVLE
jgi:hypothetical protein